MKFLVLILTICLAVFIQAEEEKIRVACVGDSITWGMTVEDRAENCYPKKLEELLGAQCRVMNFGSNGATCMRETPEKNPYIKRDAYQKGLKSNPDIVVIMLGANDSKPMFWNQKAYVNDYKKLINDFRKVAPKAKVYLCTPVSCYTKLMGPWDCNEGNLSVARLLVKDLAKEMKCELIDVHANLQNKKLFSIDGVHPNKQGAFEIAKAVHFRLN